MIWRKTVRIQHCASLPTLPVPPLRLTPPTFSLCALQREGKTRVSSCAIILVHPVFFPTFHSTSPSIVRIRKAKFLHVSLVTQPRAPTLTSTPIYSLPFESDPSCSSYVVYTISSCPTTYLMTFWCDKSRRYLRMLLSRSPLFTHIHLSFH